MVLGVILLSSCKASDAGPKDALCEDLARLHREIATIRAEAASAPYSPAPNLVAEGPVSAGSSGGSSPGRPVFSDASVELAKLANLQQALDRDAQAQRNAGQDDVADKVDALTEQVSFVVQVNTLEGVATGDAGTDPTVNMEAMAVAAGSAAACPSPSAGP